MTPRRNARPLDLHSRLLEREVGLGGAGQSLRVDVPAVLETRFSSRIRALSEQEPSLIVSASQPVATMRDEPVLLAATFHSQESVSNDHLA